MIILPGEQGSQEWIDHRLGRPTASAFKRVVTSTGRLSKQREKYVAELLAEWVTGDPWVQFETEWTERGKELEPEARRAYGFLRDVDPVSVGFCLHDSGVAGCSPDGLVGEPGLLELKCPGAPRHIYYLAHQEVPSDYVAQVQGQIWVTGREWCDFMSYHPGLPPFLIRVAPDPTYQKALSLYLPDLHAELEEGRERLIKLGVKGWEDGKGTDDPDDGDAADRGEEEEPGGGRG